MIDDGYVKFICEWIKAGAPGEIEDLIAARNELYKMGLIGQYAESGIGFGNVSKRFLDTDLFVVSGSATGGIPISTAAHYCLVEQYDIENNTVSCRGPVTASSESMTHAMLYACSPGVGCILHVHHKGFWQHLMNQAPTTAENVSYGTPAMATEMTRLMATTNLSRRKILAMAGHEEGIIAFGATVHNAMQKIIEEWGYYLKKV